MLLALEGRALADLRARHATAVHRLFGEVGVDIDNASIEYLAATADKMVAKLPGRLRKPLMQMAAKVQEDGSRKCETA